MTSGDLLNEHITILSETWPTYLVLAAHPVLMSFFGPALYSTVEKAIEEYYHVSLITLVRGQRSALCLRAGNVTYVGSAVFQDLRREPSLIGTRGKKRR